MKNLIALFGFLIVFSSVAVADDLAIEAEGSIDISCAGGDERSIASDVFDSALAQCRFDSDCRFNEKCKFGQCVDKNNCSSDYECSYGNICEVGRCRPAECRGGTYDCRAGERCTNGRCERDPFAKRCTTAKDCRTYERCSMGYCQ